MVRFVYRGTARLLSYEPIAPHDVQSVTRVLEWSIIGADGLPLLLPFREGLARRLPAAVVGDLRSWVDDYALHEGMPRYPTPPAQRGSIWRFLPRQAVSIVCSDTADPPTSAEPSHLNYSRYARYADLDALTDVRTTVRRARGKLG